MSFILDALKKSENDRQRQTAPALFEVKVAPPRRRFPVWAIALGVLLAVNMLVLTWVLLRPAATAPMASPPMASPPVAATVPPSAASASNPAPANTTPPGMMTVPATVTIPTTVNIPISSAPQITVGAGVVGPSVAPPLAEEPLLAGGEPSIPPDYHPADYAPAITPAQANAAAAQRHSLPSRDEVLAQGTPLPELRLDLHVYDADPSKRFVFVNMRKAREGESLPGGIRVNNITRNGVELSYQGRSFLLEGN